LSTAAAGACDIPADAVDKSSATPQLVAPPSLQRSSTAARHVYPHEPDSAVRALKARFTRYETTANNYLRLEIGVLEHEVFCVLFLDAQHRIIALKQMFRGTVKQTSVYPREVIKESLALNAAAVVVLAHNRPLCGSLVTSNVSIDGWAWQR
jgi:DNA repair protein RadC